MLGDMLLLRELEALALGDRLRLALLDGLRLGLFPGDGDELGELLGLVEALGDRLALLLGLTLADGLTEGETEWLGLTDALGLRERLADELGLTEAEAFYVTIDETLNPPSEQALGRLNVEIGVRPTYPAEFIIVRIGIRRDGTEVATA